MILWIAPPILWSVVVNAGQFKVVGFMDEWLAQCCLLVAKLASDGEGIDHPIALFNGLHHRRLFFQPSQSPPVLLG